MSPATGWFTPGCPERPGPVRRTDPAGRRWKLVPSIVLSAIVATASAPAALALGQVSYVSSEEGAGRFTLSAGGGSAPLHASAEEYPGVLRALRDLRADIGRVTQVEPSLVTGGAPSAREVVIAGTLGKSPLVDRLVREKKLDVAGIAGRWETFLIQVVDQALPSVERALVIAGSDRRGTIYGIYDLSEQIGVSPWYWWADVPVRRRGSLHVLPGRHTRGEPAVKYRGIFINDEAPALSGWVGEKFGGFNHQFYEKVFELVLRLRGNYLWPAMWGRAFNEDDPRNPVLADEYGIVMGTSHHEPMLRAQAEWTRHGSGPWNYQDNAETLRRFWTEGIRNMGSHESIVTLGMRGDGDLAMSRESNVPLLERIVRDQREILARTTGRDPAAIPQLWALYKEVQDYYERGMRVPDDVTLLLCDDNWGNLRKLPTPAERRHAGGYGVYYHFDYVGGPRNYKWLNTNPIIKVWEQMHLAYRYGATRVWIVNVGDIKPMEFPTQFFLDYAWAPEEWPAGRLGEYTRLWAEREFGGEHAGAIGDIVSKYTKFNGRRKPELLAPDTYSLVNYREAERVVADYKALAEEAERVNASLPAEAKDAYYQLVLYPAKACANLNDLYVTVGKNRLHAGQGRAATNALAERAESLFRADDDLTRSYNKTMARGRWNHLMDQVHIGYTSWQEPPRNVMPAVRKLAVPSPPEMGVAIEGSDAWWPEAEGEATLPPLTPYQPEARSFEIFNRGQTPFEYAATAAVPWLRVEPSRGRVEEEERIRVSVDWPRAPTGTRQVPIDVTGANGRRVVIRATVENPAAPRPDRVQGFVESDGYVSIEAEHHTRAVAAPPIEWQRLPDYGRTLSAMTALPVTAPRQTPGGDSPRLEYRMHLFRAGDVKVDVYLAPTLDFTGDGLRYAVSFDDEPPRVIDMHATRSEAGWNQAVSDNIKILTTRHAVNGPGEHVLKFWMVDPGVVLEKIVVDAGGVRPSYLGPPESFHRATRPASPATPRPGLDRRGESSGADGCGGISP